MESDVMNVEAGGGLSHGRCDGGPSGLRELMEKWMWEEFDVCKASWELFFLPQYALQKAWPCPVLLDEDLEAQVTISALTIDDQWPCVGIPGSCRANHGHL